MLDAALRVIPYALSASSQPSDVPNSEIMPAAVYSRSLICAAVHGLVVCREAVGIESPTPLMLICGAAADRTITFGSGQSIVGRGAHRMEQHPPPRHGWCSCSIVIA